MAVITRTEVQVAPAKPEKSTFWDAIAGAAIEAGQVCYIDSNGVAQLGDGSAAGTSVVIGMAMKSVGAGQGVSLLMEGPVYGFDLSGLAYEALVWLSDTAGALDTATGTVGINLGRVLPASDAALTKVLYFRNFTSF